MISLLLLLDLSVVEAQDDEPEEEPEENPEEGPEEDPEEDPEGEPEAEPEDEPEEGGEPEGEISDKLNPYLDCQHFCIHNCRGEGHHSCQHRCGNGCACVEALLVINSRGHRHLTKCRGNEPSSEDVDPERQEDPWVDNSNDDYKINIIEYEPPNPKG